MLRTWLNISSFSMFYDGPSVKERINLNLFSLPFIGERKYVWIYFHSRLLGGENIFEFIFTHVYWGRKNIWIYFHSRLLGKENIFECIFIPVYWGEKIYLTVFSLPFVGGRKYISINFHSRLFGGENIFKFISTPVYWGVKINLNIFSLPNKREWK